MKKVNLFIVGAMKAGTTSFNEMLAQHPEIYFSPIKEPNYFVSGIPKRIYEPSRFFNIESYFKKQFPERLHIAHVKEASHYEKLFSLSNEDHTYRAEGSTAYLNAPETPELIYKYNPEAKIIILLRNPLKRAFSHYKMDLAKGRTKEKFSTLINNELNKGFNKWGYLGMSLYYDKVMRYINYFGKDNVLVLSFENLINKGFKSNELQSFLGIENEGFEIKNKNKSRKPRFILLIFLLKKIGLKDSLSFLLPKRLKDKSSFFLYKENDDKLDSKLSEKINTFFNEDQKNLYKLMNT